jgi:uncharacterized protein YciI
MCWDGPDAATLRVRDLDGHLAHVEKHWRSYVIAGPMREPGGDKLIGSLLLVLAETIDEAWSICRGDPYFTNGQFKSVEVKNFTQSIGTAIGGKIWESADALRARAAGGPAIGKS